MTAPITRSEVLAAQARAEKATEGPWTLMDTPLPSREDHGWRAIVLVGKRMVAVTKRQIWGERTSRDADESASVRENNLSFIASARADVPRLAATLLEFAEALKYECDCHVNHCICENCQWLRKFGSVLLWLVVVYVAVSTTLLGSEMPRCSARSGRSSPSATGCKVGRPKDVLIGDFRVYDHKIQASYPILVFIGAKGLHNSIRSDGFTLKPLGGHIEGLILQKNSSLPSYMVPLVFKFGIFSVFHHRNNNLEKNIPGGCVPNIFKSYRANDGLILYHRDLSANVCDRYPSTFRSSGLFLDRISAILGRLGLALGGRELPSGSNASVFGVSSGLGGRNIQKIRLSSHFHKLLVKNICRYGDYQQGDNTNAKAPPGIPEGGAFKWSKPILLYNSRDQRVREWPLAAFLVLCSFVSGVFGAQVLLEDGRFGQWFDAWHNRVSGRRISDRERVFIGFGCFLLTVFLLAQALISVTQKYFDRSLLLYYTNYMANVLSADKQIAIIGSLCEGSSIRSIERITGVHRDTIMRLGVRVGQGCTALMDEKMRNLTCTRLEMDEIWGFIGKKDRNVRLDDNKELGSIWTFCAIDADTKLVPAFKVGKRVNATANAFVQDVASRMSNRVQISTDGLRAYVDAIEASFGAEVDFAQIVKTYGREEASDNRRYSAPEFVSSEIKVVVGNPNMDLVSTSYIERLNATTRLHMRRLTRLTLAFSKKLENFEAAVGLHFAYYNFVKRHNTVRCTPAMAAGVTAEFWSVSDLVKAAA